MVILEWNFSRNWALEFIMKPWCSINQTKLTGLSFHTWNGSGSGSSVDFGFFRNLDLDQRPYLHICWAKKWKKKNSNILLLILSLGLVFLDGQSRSRSNPIFGKLDPEPDQAKSTAQHQGTNWQSVYHKQHRCSERQIEEIAKYQ